MTKSKKPKDEFLIGVNTFIFPKLLWQLKQTKEHYILTLNKPKKRTSVRK